ncbi:MAG: insulinase family protein [Acidaminococcaceae bacterium]
MSLEKEQIYSGFIVKEVAFIEEVKATAYLLEHLQSGARVLYLGNQDDNKVFSISFRTPPYDDTGVAHILEHSVLCGSRKYKLKEPFVELVKGSLNTFLNAMTYPDKTMYPVASRNNQDFKNLMDVYLDAVFYPLIHENPYTLFQEGWHYNIDTPEAPLTYNGVVYNEMKGVFSSADAVMDYESMKALFPNSPYGFESGGYPETIANLTQEQFSAFHKTYYSPENSYIYLYGDLDILSTLAYLDQEYLSSFHKTGTVNSGIAMQPAFPKTKEVFATYPIGKEEDTAGKTYHELNIVTGDANDVLTSTALRLLESVLLESNSAPLRLALMQAGIGSDVFGSYAGSYRQPIFSIKAAGSEPEQRDKFLSIIYKTLQELTVQGLDKELLEANLNFMEFKLREADFGAYPKGLIYGISCMESWLYDGDPFAGLRYEEILKTLREGINSRYYEQLIENYLLDNTHKVLITLQPEPGKEEADQAREVAKLAQIKSKLTTTEINTLIAQTEKLHALQGAEDDVTALESIPILNRSDLRQEVDTIATEITHVGEHTYLYVPQDTNKIAYLNWYFDLTGLPAKLLPYAYLLSDLLGKLDTKDFTFQELATNTNKYTGGIGFQLSAYSSQTNADDYSLQFGLQTKALTHNLEQLFFLLENIATSTNFDNQKRMQEVIGEIKTDWDSQFFNRGQNIACTRLCSYFSQAARVNEKDYLSYYQFIKTLADNFEERFTDLKTQLVALLPLLFHRSKQLFAYSCEQHDQKLVLTAAQAFVQSLSVSTYAGQKPELLVAPESNEGIVTSGKVQYVAAGGNFQKFGHTYTGAMKVLETILRYDYLWTKIRVQGGAYGANARFDPNGTAYFSSYRDPKLAETLTVYQQLPAYLEGFSASERELTKYVIGTISGMDTPLTNSMYLERACVMYLKQITDVGRLKSRLEVINVTNEDIRKLSVIVKDLLSDNYHCVVGSQSQIEKNTALFNNIINI